MAESAVVACPDEVSFIFKQLEHSGSLVDPIKKSHNYSNFLVQIQVCVKLYISLQNI